MSGYSPEPWAYDLERSEVLSQTGGVVFGGPWADDGTLAWDEDLRRIVACVNACRGIPTKMLEDIAVNNRRLFYRSPPLLVEGEPPMDVLRVYVPGGSKDVRCSYSWHLPKE